MASSPPASPPGRDTPAPPRVVPWVALGSVVGLAVAAAIALAAARSDRLELSGVQLAAVGTATVLFGLVVGLAVGQFIRIAGIVGAWRPTLPTVLDAPPPSPNGHGSTRRGRPNRSGALLAVIAAVGAVLAGSVVVALQPAPIVLAVGALALDERVWVRVVAASGLLVAGMGLVGFLARHTVPVGIRRPAFLAGVVVVGVVAFLAARWVRPAS